ncbi:MAG: hypothetical protein JWN34_3221 [Bryobacterales bacterium]|jgi:hypothetical protein|nr:hypothetical protein [Bryobacterales bacterium]
MRYSKLAIILLLAFLPAVKGMTLSDFAGTWTMDTARSESALQEVPVTAATVTFSLVGTGLLMETTRSWGGKARESHETLNLRLDRSETTSTTDDGHTITTKAHMDGAKLVVETARNVNQSTVTTTYIYALGAAGHEMSVDMTLTVQHGYEGAAARNTGRGKDIFVRASR